MRPTAQRKRLPRTAAAWLAGLVLTALAPSGARAAEDDPLQFVEFVEDFEAVCVQREGVMILVRNRHPSKALRIWMERWHMGANTGDRGKSELLPGGEAEKLGCSRTLSGKQEWRVIRAQFIETG